MLGCTSPLSFIQLCARDQQAWNKLCRFFKNIKIKAYPSRKGKIAELILDAGNVKFTNPSGEILTVEVRGSSR